MSSLQNRNMLLDKQYDTGQFSACIVTNIGKEMIAKSQNGQTLTFTRVALGDGLIDDDDDILSFTKVKNERLSANIAKWVDKQNGQFQIQFRVSNQEVEIGFWQREIGIMAKIDGGEEQLYAYATSGNGADFLYDKTTPIDERIVNIDFVIGNAENVQVIVNGSIIYATIEDLENAIDEHNTDENAHDNLIKRLFGSAEATLDSIKLKIKEWAKEVCLPLSGGTMNGNINASGYNITATKFIGNLQGKADSATNADLATKANQDSQGQVINTTYVKGVTASNATLTVTKGNGTTSTVTINNVGNSTKATQDSQGQAINTTYIKSITASNATLTVTKGNGTTSTVTINNVENSKKATQDGSGNTITTHYLSRNQSTQNDMNACTVEGIYRFSGTLKNGWTSDSWGTLLVFNNHYNGGSGAVGTYLVQIALPTDGRMWTRQRVNTGAWTSWNKLANTTDCTDTLKKVYPVGSIYMSTVSTNPATLFGFGTWEAMPAGRVLLAQGKSSWGTTYNAGSTGGEATHQLTVGEMPSHGHTASTDTININGGFRLDGAEVGGTTSASGVFSIGSSFTPSKGHGNSGGGSNAGRNINFNSTHSHKITINNVGEGQSHNNIQPYLTIYMWKRVS